MTDRRFRTHGPDDKCCADDRERLIAHGRLTVTTYTARDPDHLREVAGLVWKGMRDTAEHLDLELSEPVVTDHDPDQTGTLLTVTAAVRPLG